MNLLATKGRKRFPDRCAIGKRCSGRLAAFLVGLLLVAAPAWGQSRPGIYGPTDHREKAATARWPWSAIGLVRSPNSYCTGALIASDRVLTAAHCLWDRNAKAWREPNAMRFELGYDRGATTGQARVKRFVVDEALRGPRGTLLENHDRTRDWAVLVLKVPLDQMPIKLSEPTVLAPTAVMLPGYGQSSSLLLHKDCTLWARDGGLLLHRCDSLPGTSGGPILAFYGGDPRPVIIGVHVGTQRNNGFLISHAVAVRDQIIAAARRG